MENTTKEEIVHHPPFNPLEGCLWPDPDPSRSAECLLLNDVSCMSETAVDALFYPQTEEDVLHILNEAVINNKRISTRGTQHSMGGHSLVKAGYVIDTRYLNQLQYDSVTQQITCGTGCTWTDIIRCLNEHGKSPAVLQSYCTFSVGGTVSVNAHGITSDKTLSSCLREFRLARYDATSQSTEIITCTRPSNMLVSLDHPSKEEELFGLAVGGYGLFGVITQVTLEVSDNVDLILDSLNRVSTISSNVDKQDEPCEFERIWGAARQDSTVNIKLARLNVLTLETASVYIFRRASRTGATTSSQLQVQPKELSYAGRLLYKWALPLLKAYRHSVEESTGQALDMPPINFVTTRNDVLWESAVPLAKLLSPLVLVNDTFVLQEFFVPYDKFATWIHEAKSIFQDIEVYQRQGADGVPSQSLILLNTTIRYVDQDLTTFLSYSSKPGGAYAFVLYYRIKRLEQVEDVLGVFHNRLAEVAVRLGGTFYLPYRKCYSQELLQQAYPQIASFAAKKEKYDAIGLFSNEWFERYVITLCSDSYQSCFWGGDWSSQIWSDERKGRKCIPKVLSKEEFMSWLPRQDDPLLERRANSYRKLLQDNHLRKKFSEEFLVTIFNIADPLEVVRVMSKAAWDPRNKNDLAIYAALREHFYSPLNIGASVKQGWRAVRQLSHQKAELTNETAAILHRLGRFGRIRGYLSVGDHGKTVRSFQAAGLLEKSNESQIFVAHSFHPDTDELSMSVVLERGSAEPVGDVRIQFDFIHDDVAVKFKVIPTSSIDLVTLNQGLHHFPPNKLYNFLIEVRRVIREGGLFIFREHDLRLQSDTTESSTTTPIAMLDLAHSIFNAVTGSSVEDEASEIRAFRPVSEWRAMMKKVGFVDTMEYGLELGDCTCDFMLCFSKGHPRGAALSWSPPQSSTAETDKAASRQSEPLIMDTIRTLLAQFPTSALKAAICIISHLLEKLPLIQDGISRILPGDLPVSLHAELTKGGTEHLNISSEMMSSLLKVVSDFLVNKVENLLTVGIGAKGLLREISVRETANVAGLLSTPELWLILPVLKRRMTELPESIGELEKALLQFVEMNLPVLLQVKEANIIDRHSSKNKTGRVDDFTPTNKNTDTETMKSEEVQDAILTLCEAMPSLRDPSIILVDSGLTLSQQSFLVGALAASDLPAFSENLAWYHDQQSWKVLRSALVGDHASVLLSKDLPTVDRLFSKELGHSWRRALKAFLKGPRVQFKQSTILGLRILKLDALILLYKEAKEEAAAERSQMQQHGRDLASSLPNQDSRVLNLYTERILFASYKRKEVVVQFHGEADYDLFDVAFVVKAEFGYRSLTSRLTDVTNELRSYHTDVQRRLAAERDHRSVQGLASHQAIRKKAAACIGWLPIRETVLSDFRNKGAGVRFGDTMRQVVVSTGTLGFAGGNVLILNYIPLQTNLDTAIDAMDRLCYFVRNKGLVQTNLHKYDGHYTWFKLSEWMQVEIMDLLVKSLDHTPWYHFPFMEFLSIYFQVLFQECKIVANEHGLAEAYGSMAFATDFIPGVVMSFIFSQLQLLASPLKLSLLPYNPESMVEEVLMTAPLFMGENPLQLLRNTIDERILDASLLCMPRDSVIGLYQVKVPTFKAMGEILIKFGERIPSAMIVQISNQRVIQTLLSVEFDEPSSSTDSQAYLDRLEAAINCREGLKVVLRYRYPMDMHSLRQAGEIQARLVYLAVKVHVPSLLTLVRLTANYDRVSVKQIFDFWSG